MKSPGSLPLLISLATGLLALPAVADVPAKVTYNDHILPIFKNACLNCHNPDKKKAGLDLSTYQTTLVGSDNGKVLESGNSSASLLIKCCKQIEDPKMPPKGDKLTDAEIALLEKWVTGQLLESANGKAVASANNVQTAVVSLERPAGPPPMPTADLPLESLVHTKTTNALVALAASPWAPLVAVGGQKQIILYRTDTLSTVGILPFPEGFPAIIRFSRNGQLLLTGGGLGGKSGKVVLWNVQTGERVGEVGNEFDQVLGADLSPDQAHVALGGPGKILKIYSTKDGKLEQSIKKHTDWITAVAFSPDGKFLASADRNGGISVWEGVTGREFNSLPGHKAAVTALAFMPGVLASAGEDGKIMLWDVKEGKEIRSWNGHGGGVSSVDFTTDGRLVSAGRDKVAKAWDQTGKTLATSEAFTDIALRAVAADDRMIAGDWTGRIRVFNLKDGAKPVGELTSNPPSIAESLAAAEKEWNSARSTIPTAQEGLVNAEKSVKAALELLQGKHQQELASAEAAVATLRKAIDSGKTGTDKPGEDLKALQDQLAEARKIRDAASDGDRPAAQDKVNTLKAKIADAQSKGGANAAPGADLEKKMQEATAALDAVQKQEVKLLPPADAAGRVTEATKKVDALKAEAAKLVEARDKQKSGSNEYNQANDRVNQKNGEVAQAQAALDAAKLAASASPPALEVARCKTVLEQAEAKASLAKNEFDRWQRAQAFMGVHKAKQTLADLQVQFEDLQATAKDALSPIAKAETDMAAAGKTISDNPALVKEKEAAAVEAKGKAESATKAAAEAEAALADQEKKKKALAEALVKATADAPELTKKLMTAKASLDREEKADKKEEGSPEATAQEEKLKKLREEVATAQTASDAANKIVAEAKAQDEALATAITKAKETVASSKLEAKAAATASTKAQADLVAVRNAGTAAVKQLADLKKNSASITEAAHAAKVKAEQDAVIVAAQLEKAKAEAARIRAEYEAHYKPTETKAPLASS